MKRKIRFPIAIKVVTVVVTIMIFVGILTAQAVISEEREALTRQIELRGLTMIRSLESATAPLILDRNDPEIETAVARMSQEDIVVFTTIASSKGRILSHSDMKLRGKPLGETDLPTDVSSHIMQEVTWNDQPVFLFAGPIRFAGKPLGTAYVALSQSVLTDALAVVKRLESLTGSKLVIHKNGAPQPSEKAELVIKKALERYGENGSFVRGPGTMVEITITRPKA